MSLAKDPAEMTDDELLERIAALDPEQYPVATHAQRALDSQEDSS